jgi:radical SAM-linked protein
LKRSAKATETTITAKEFAFESGLEGPWRLPTVRKACWQSRGKRRVFGGAVGKAGSGKDWGYAIYSTRVLCKGLASGSILAGRSRDRMTVGLCNGHNSTDRKEMQGFTARVRYRKRGLLRFIGHLSTMRTLLRAIRRAGIQGAYSQGFSPKIRLSFGPPIPLGCTSDCEYFDIRLADKSEPDVIRQRLQSRLPEGLSIGKVEVLDGKPPSLATAFWAVEYEIELPKGLRLSPERMELLDAERGGSTGESDPSGGCRRTSSDRIVRASLKEKDGGKQVISLVLRQYPSGGGRLKEVIGEFLGIQGSDVEKARIHKSKVYQKGEGAQ